MSLDQVGQTNGKILMAIIEQLTENNKEMTSITRIQEFNAWDMNGTVNQDGFSMSVSGQCRGRGPTTFKANL